MEELMENKNNNHKKRFIRLPKEKVEQVIKGMVEIELKPSPFPDQPNQSNFLLVREALSRIGVKKNDTLYQSVHILQKQGKYYLCHFKQLFALDGLETSFNDTDLKRLHKIAYLLEKWNMITVLDRSIIKKVEENAENNVFVHVVPVEQIKNGVVKRVKKYDL